MNIFNDFKKFFSTTKGIVGGSWKTIAGGSYSTKAQVQAYSDWVYIAISVIAETVGSLDFYVKNSKGERMENHKLNELLKDGEFIELITSSLGIFGNAYVLKDGKDFRILEPNKVTANHVKGIITGYSYLTSKYDVDSIIHLKVPNILDLTSGTATIDRIMDWVSNSKNGTAIKDAFYRNGGTLTTVLETEYETEDELEILSTSFDNAHKGVNNSNKALILPNGVKYIPPAKIGDIHNSQEANADRDRILSAFRVPKHILGITEQGSSKADAEAKLYAFYKFAIVPMARRVANQLSKGLISEFRGVRRETIDFVDPTPTDEANERENIKVALAGQPYETINEVRERKGLPPVENGDNLLINGTPTALGVPQEVEKTLKPKDMDQGLDRLEKTLKSIGDEKKKVIDTFSSLTEVQQEAIHKDFNDRSIAGSNKLRNAILDQQKEFKDRIIKDLSSKKELIAGTLELDRQLEEDELYKVTFAIADDLSGVEGALAMSKLTSDPYVQRESFKQTVEALVKLNVNSYTNTTINLLEKEIAIGIAEGETFQKIAERVEDVFSLGDDYRAYAIAQDTVFGTSNEAIREAYKQSGVVQSLKWYTAQDERVCPECAPLHGKEVAVDEIFIDEGEEIQRNDGKTRVNDWRPIYSAPLHSRCRCFTLPEKISV